MRLLQHKDFSEEAIHDALKALLKVQGIAEARSLSAESAIYLKVDKAALDLQALGQHDLFSSGKLSLPSDG